MNDFLSKVSKKSREAKLDLKNTHELYSSEDFKQIVSLHFLLSLTNTHSPTHTILWTGKSILEDLSKFTQEKRPDLSIMLRLSTI